MSFIDAFIIGALQGLTEFLPISSSGHLVIMQHLLNVNIAGNLVEVAAHVGTLLSVLIFYKKEIINICLTLKTCLLYTSPSPRDLSTSRMPSSA